MDIKYEIEFKDEPLEWVEYNEADEQIFGLWDFQDQSCVSATDIKSEIEVKEEPLNALMIDSKEKPFDDIMEDSMNDENFKLKYEIGERQNFIFEDHKENVDVIEGKGSSGSDHELRRKTKQTENMIGRNLAVQIVILLSKLRWSL